MARPYDFNLVNLILTYEGGTHYVVGFAEGSTINVARDSDKYTVHKGLKGDVSYAKTNDNSGTITVTLKHNSPSNAVLSLLSKDDNTFGVQMVDGNDIGRAKAGGSDCVIMKPGDMSRGAEIGEREWVIAVPNLAMDDE